MSTRCYIEFYDDSDPDKSVVLYRAFDGYPGTPDGKEIGILEWLTPFMRKYRKPLAPYPLGTLAGLCISYDTLRTDAQSVKIFGSRGDMPYATGAPPLLIWHIYKTPDVHADYWYRVTPDTIKVYRPGVQPGPQDIPIMEVAL